MKQKVIIFTGKHMPIFTNNGIEEHGTYDEEALQREINQWFPNNLYEVKIVDYPRIRVTTLKLDSMWKYERLPILIGFEVGANYLEEVKNYRRKYLLSPTNRHDTIEVSEYDVANTYCFFGCNKKDKENEKLFHKHYSETLIINPTIS